jgi:RNA binding exosome subunit
MDFETLSCLLYLSQKKVSDMKGYYGDKLVKNKIIFDGKQIMNTLEELIEKNQMKKQRVEMESIL